MRFLSLFSGIEAASCAWVPLGWECVGVAEIEKFPSAVLAHHYPDVPNLGDITQVTEEQIKALGHVDLVVGGFPCQDLSVAGKRKGLRNDDGSVTRSGLFFDAMRIVRWSGARYVLLENVPGIYSSNRGRDFAAVVGEILGVEFGVPPNGWENTGVAASERGLLEWATLDAQWFGVAQRRRRMFALADFGDWRDRGPVLFERHSLSGHPAPRRETGEGIAVGTLAGTSPGGGWRIGPDEAAAGHVMPVWPADVACTLNAAFGSKQGLEDQHALGGGIYSSLPAAAQCLTTGTGQRFDPETETLIPTIGGGFDEAYSIRTANTSSNGWGVQHEVTHTLDQAQGLAVAHTLRGDGFDASEDGTGRGTPLVPVAFDTTQITSAANYSNPKAGDPCHPLAAGAHAPAIAFDWQSGGDSRGLDPKDTAQLQRCQVPATMQGMAVRRLTPRECERLQGFRDDYTAIPWRGKPASDCPDGPRYKALGNSMAVPCMAWIGRRIAAVAAQDLERAA